MTSRGRSASYLRIDDRFSSRADAWGRSYLVTPNPRVHGTVRRNTQTIGFQASFKETKFTSEILPNPMNNLDESSMNPVLRSPSPMNWEMYCELGPILRSPSPMNWEMYCELGPILRSPSPKNWEEYYDMGRVEIRNNAIFDDDDHNYDCSTLWNYQDMVS
jgi:hypothetical protein